MISVRITKPYRQKLNHHSEPGAWHLGENYKPRHSEVNVDHTEESHCLITK